MLVTGPMCLFGGTSVLSCYWESFTLSCLLLTYSFVCCCCRCCLFILLFFFLGVATEWYFLWLFLIFALSKEATIILFYRNPIWPYVSELLNNVAVAADAWFRLLQLHHNLRHNWKPLLTHNFPCISVV